MYKRYWGILLTYICFIFSALYVFAPILISGFGVPEENSIKRKGERLVNTRVEEQSCHFWRLFFLC